MKQQHVLITGGYGAVGSIVATLLSKNEGIVPVVAGRNENQAKKLAEKLNCRWTTVNLENMESIQKALKNIDIVINCFIPSGDFNIILPEMTANQGIHYLDVAAYNRFNEKVIGLHEKAVKNEATLITALGLFPGIPGLILGNSKDYFDEVDCADIFFTSGGNMENITPLALQGIGYLMSVTPTNWEGEEWVKSSNVPKKEYISEPFNKSITFFPYMVTFDLLKIPEITKINKINMWSMSESMFLGVFLLLGLKMGFAKTVKRAARFLTLLRFLGRNKNEHYAIKIVSRGKKGTVSLERTVEMNAPEEYLTALVTAIVCEQIVNGHIRQAGAFTGAEVVDMQKFTESLRKSDIQFRDNITVQSK
jgi:saccharopine dehydrogenase-like NADP-dependent oxidoreductase